jgi:hypothetical protein
MNAEEDMEKPVTKRELLEVTTKLEAKFDAKFDTFLGAILARVDQVAGELVRYISEVEHRLREHVSTELAIQTRGIERRHLDELSAHDEKYKDLPPRVSRLEAAVFPPGAPPAKRQRRR